MAGPTPLIRPARPEDVDAATPRIFSSGPDSFRYVFARRCPDEAHAFIADAFIREHTELSYRYHWVAEVDGDVVGTAAGYTGTTAERFLWPIIGRIFRFALVSFTWVAPNNPRDCDRCFSPKERVCVACG